MTDGDKSDKKPAPTPTAAAPLKKKPKDSLGSTGMGGFDMRAAAPAPVAPGVVNAPVKAAPAQPELNRTMALDLDEIEEVVLPTSNPLSSTMIVSNVHEPAKESLARTTVLTLPTANPENALPEKTLPAKTLPEKTLPATSLAVKTPESRPEPALNATMALDLDEIQDLSASTIATTPVNAVVIPSVPVVAAPPPVPAAAKRKAKFDPLGNTVMGDHLANKAGTVPAMDATVVPTTASNAVLAPTQTTTPSVLPEIAPVPRMRPSSDFLRTMLLDTSVPTELPVAALPASASMPSFEAPARVVKAGRHATDFARTWVGGLPAFSPTRPTPIETTPPGVSSVVPAQTPAMITPVVEPAMWLGSHAPPAVSTHTETAPAPTVSRIEQAEDRAARALNECLAGAAGMLPVIPLLRGL